MPMYETKIGYLNLSPLPVMYERMANRDLVDRPFVVVGTVGSRGLITAVSGEAFRAGVRPGITPDSARVFIPELRVIEERPALYYDAAQQVNDVCERFVPIVDPERQDAFVLDLTGTDRLYPDPTRLILRLQETVSSEVNLASRAGLGISRLVARLAASRADDLGVYAVNNGEEDAFLADYPVTVLPGVGTRIAGRLRWLGIRTVRELAAAPVQTLEAAFGPKGIDIVRAAHGHDPRPKRKSHEHKPLKRSVNLEQLFYNPRMVRTALGKLVADLGLELRSAEMQVRSIALEIRYPDTSPVTRRKSIPPTDLDVLLNPVVEKMYCDMKNRRVRLRWLSLNYSRLIPSDDQLLLEFALDAEREKCSNLENAMDKLRRKYGVEAIGPGTWLKKLKSHHDPIKNQ